MKKYSLLLFIFIFMGCGPKDSVKQPNTGMWQAKLKVKDNNTLPFNFELYETDNQQLQLKVLNGEEIITVDEITINNDSILIKAPVFEGYITAQFSETAMKGKFIIESLDRIVSFEAIFGEENRFSATKSPNGNVSGIWETVFSPNTEDSYMGKGIFTQNDGVVSGTFRTTTGDYRYLEGVMDKDSLKLSAFDGAHAFLFLAKVDDSIMDGIFYSGNHFKEPFTAKRNEAYELPSPDSLTFIKEGYDELTFTFPDMDGNQVALSDSKFENKVVIVQLMGSWCPNCLDETKFLVDYLEKNKNEDLAVVGLAFEQAKTKELAKKSIQRLVDRIGITYPILLAQYGTYDKEKAQEKLPMLNHVLSYPTTIFVDKKGEVRKIHTGFNGPATGDKFEDFKLEFNEFIAQLLSEQ
ncbi:TlpA disulfide reductase family protein [Maribacter sp. PR1]|uniref:TlpA disulfide reductase family protein n=1 Tax=Maribacter cobaltidurans TaxID=1178778 RepID=A0ABU7IRZ4_9FLAO|nr:MULTISPECIES: TlpA disulfide reductase family protein [Maribacter]MDC6388358.1 TlpA disulfide reductase family protein [Maribacter sp. PR1]MEE1975747.1 TlpA disulfide reductase family protein [Maribacter cobaltidurans]